jgi:hypothetical protein
MKKIGAVLVVLFAVASSAFAEKFLSVSDIHLNPFADPSIVAKLEVTDATEWGAVFASSTATPPAAYGSDLPNPLLLSAVAEMKKQISSPAFILISGDFLAHGFNKTYQQYATDKSQDAYTAFVTKTIAYIATVFGRTFPGVPIYPVLGNNDSDCGDYAVAPGGAFLAMFADTWSFHVRSRSFDRGFVAGGYYYVDVPALKNVRVIGLNTNFFSTKYTNPCGAPGPDPGTRELNWMKEELRLARRHHKRVWMLFHIPPGADVFDTEQYGGACPGTNVTTFWKDEYQQEYLKITAAYRDTIIGSFAGHTHQDEFRIANGDFIHITPSVTPIFGNNPAFEVVDVERDGAITDYTTWKLPDLTAPWTREYAFVEAYRKSRYDTAALTKLAASIGTDAPTRARYFDFYSSGNAKSTAQALGMWQGYWCGLTAISRPAFASCRCR